MHCVFHGIRFKVKKDWVSGTDALLFFSYLCIMNRKKIEVEVASISSSQVEAGAFAMVMQEVDGERKLPIIIGAYEAQAVLFELKKMMQARPMTHHMFCSVLKTLGAELLRVLIYRVESGVFFSYLYLKQGDTIYRVDSRTSDAVIMALHLKAPVLVYEDILDAERVKSPEEAEEAAKQGRKPERWSLEMLQAELKRAVEDEDYEKAAMLRDEINRRTENEKE